MKLNHLTFGQLYKLAHPTTLMRVEQAAPYHAMQPLPERYRKVLAFLRGSELKAALKKSAAVQDIPYVPGVTLELCRIPERSPQIMEAHANIIYTFVKLAGGVPSVWQGETGTYMLVSTTPLGIAALNYKPGLKWKTIKQECAIENTFPISIFWWVNLLEPRLQDDDRFNPAVWPCNTPRVAEIAESLVTRAS